jgi:hypothetical protein
MSGVASDGEFWMAKVQSIIHHLEGDAKHLKPLARSDGDGSIIQKARDLIARLQKVRRINVESSIHDSAFRRSRAPCGNQPEVRNCSWRRLSFENDAKMDGDEEMRRRWK